MLRFLIGTIVNAVGLWAATTIVPQVTLTPYGGDGLWETIGSYLVIGAMTAFTSPKMAPISKNEPIVCQTPSPP